MYRSGTNAAARGTWSEPVLAWGPEGSVRRIPTAADGATLLGEPGPLWIVDRELPKVERGAPVPAALVERAGFRLREVLGSQATLEIDPARGAGVSMRSMIKMRRELAPPVYLVVATRGAHGIPGPDGPSAVQDASDCKAALAVVDAEAEAGVDHALLAAAEATCAVPVLVGPVDLDGDGVKDVLVHGQSGTKGFRAWYRVGNDGKLTAGPASVWTEIP